MLLRTRLLIAMRYIIRKDKFMNIIKITEANIELVLEALSKVLPAYKRQFDVTAYGSSDLRKYESAEQEINEIMSKIGEVFDLDEFDTFGLEYDSDNYDVFEDKINNVLEIETDLIEQPTT